MLSFELCERPADSGAAAFVHKCMECGERGAVLVSGELQKSAQLKQASSLVSYHGLNLP